MYAEIERLLSQIKCESASDLLGAGTSGGSTPGPASSTSVRTGIGVLDEALGEITEGAPIIELLGTPASGKTQALYRICLGASLAGPVTLADGRAVDLGGHGRHTLFLDVDGKSDMRLLARYTRALARDKLADHGSEQELDEIVDAALDRVHVFAPDSTLGLIATLAQLPKYVEDRGLDKSQCVLLVDGLGTHFWFDRRAANHVTLKSRQATPAFRMQQLFVDTLQEVRAYLGCVCFVSSVLFLRHTGDLAATKSASQESESLGSQGSSQLSQAQGRMARVVEAGQVAFNDHMIPRWRSVVARSFVLEAAPVSGSPQVTGITLTEVGGGRRQQTVYVGAQGLRTMR